MYVQPLAIRIYDQWSIYGLWATTRRSFQSNLGQQSLISFIHPSCTAMPTRDGARQIPHDPYAKPCRCPACRRMRWTFPKAGYRRIAYCQSRPYAYLAYNNTPSRSTYQIMHTIHHHTPNPLHRRSNSSTTSSGMLRTSRLRKMNRTVSPNC